MTGAEVVTFSLNDVSFRLSNADSRPRIVRLQSNY